MSIYTLIEETSFNREKNYRNSIGTKDEEFNPLERPSMIGLYISFRSLLLGPPALTHGIPATQPAERR